MGFQSFRNLAKPVGALNAERLKQILERYESFQDPDIPPFMYVLFECEVREYYFRHLHYITHLHHSPTLEHQVRITLLLGGNSCVLLTTTRTVHILRTVHARRTLRCGRQTVLRCHVNVERMFEESVGCEGTHTGVVLLSRCFP